MRQMSLLSRCTAMLAGSRRGTARIDTYHRSSSTRCPRRQAGTHGQTGCDACNSTLGRMTALGLVSRAWSVQTAMRNFTGDEGRSFKFDNQVLISSHRKLLSSKAMVVNVAESRDEIPERGERNRTATEDTTAASVDKSLAEVAEHQPFSTVTMIDGQLVFAVSPGQRGGFSQVGHLRPARPASNSPG